ncbi:hypothetical protein D3C72_1931390 [compost metagenome]
MYQSLRLLVVAHLRQEQQQPLVEVLARSIRFDRGDDLGGLDVADYCGHGVEQHFARVELQHFVVLDVDVESGACCHANLDVAPDAVLGVVPDERLEQFLHALGFVDCHAELVRVALLAC